MPGREVVGLELRDVLDLHAEAGPMADGEGALQVEAAAARAARSPARARGRSPPGASTKWNVSSWARASGVTRTVPRATVGGRGKGSKVTVADVFGPRLARCWRTVRPSTSKVTSAPSTGRGPLLTRRAEAMTRSRPES